MAFPSIMVVAIVPGVVPGQDSEQIHRLNGRVVVEGKANRSVI